MAGEETQSAERPGYLQAEEIVLEGMLPGYAAMLLVSHGALAAQAQFPE